MRWAGDSPHCYTNRAGIWAFITRDKSVKGVWRRFSVRNITTPLNHYIRQASLVRCPNYDTLRKTDPPAALKVRLRAGEDALNEVCTDGALGLQIEGQHPEFAGKLDAVKFSTVQNKINSHYAQIGVKKKAHKPLKVYGRVGGLVTER
jgi:hypothetical protein